VGSVEFITPTTRAFTRMKRVLFEPFDIKKWFLLGFSAWLAALVDGGGGGNGLDVGDGGSGGDWDPGSWGQWISENTLLAVAIILGVLLVILFVFAIVVALIWVSSRGKFMFLDNLVHDRTLISQPWKEFSREANSLFIWRLVLGFGGFFAIIGLAAAAVFCVFGWFESEMPLWWVGVGVLGVALLLVILALSYVTVMLEEFIVPLMYKNRVKTMEGVRLFLALHGQRLIDFILYFIWIILLWIAAIMGIVLVGLLTCCVGFLIMIIPYLGTVFLLPVAVFFRYLGPEFLRQFGPEFDILAVRNDGESGA
jgi:hypothetical protein